MKNVGGIGVALMAAVVIACSGSGSGGGAGAGGSGGSGGSSGAGSGGSAGSGYANYACYIPGGGTCSAERIPSTTVPSQEDVCKKEKGVPSGSCPQNATLFGCCKFKNGAEQCDYEVPVALQHATMATCNSAGNQWSAQP